MTSDTLLHTLEKLWKQGLELWLNNDQLGFKAPPNLLQGENLAFIKSEKNNIINLLAEQPQLMQGFPVTQGQAAMFTAQHVDSQNPKFNLAVCVLLKNKIDVDALSKSLQYCLQQHPILTASFSLSPLPSQAIRQTLQKDRSITLDSLSVDNTIESDARTWASEVFDTEADCLIRAALITSDSKQYLSLSCHHLVCDFIGLQNVLTDIQSEYQRITDDTTTTKNTNAIVDFKAHVIAEQALQLADDIPASLQEIFNDTANDLAEINFSGFKSNKEVAASSGELSFNINTALTTKILSYSAQKHSSVFILAASAFSILLARLSTDKQFIISTPLANRFGAQIHGAGHFTNPLPLLADFNPEDTNSTNIAAQLKQQLHALVKAQNYSAELLQEKYSYASNVAFSFNRLDSQAFNGSLYQQLILAEQLSHTHDLILTGFQLDASLTFSFRYDNQLISLNSAQRFQRLFESILSLMVSDDTEQNFVQSHCFLSPEERLSIQRSNQTNISYPSNNLASQFFHQAQISPNNTALSLPAELMNTESAQTFTYSELSSLAKHYQHWISQQPLVKNDVIAIYGERDQHYLAIMIAGLALGLAVTPIDTQFPPERIKHMLASSQSKIVFYTCTDDRLDILNELSTKPTPWVNVHEQCVNNFTSNTQELPCIDTAPEQVNIIFFTSGSTGLPKPVPATQAAMARLSHHNRFFNLQEKEACLFASNTSFDATNIEIWNTLLHGGELVAVNKDILLAPSILHKIFIRHDIKHAFFTTALFNTLIAFEPTFFSHCTTIMFGGEACDNHAIDNCLKRGKPQHLMHMYGPTENGAISTTYELNNKTFNLNQATSIGTATGNSTAWVVDQFNNLQIPGGVGELLVGGDGVAPGYLSSSSILNIESLNQEKFITDLFSPVNSVTKRLYRSGDLVYTDEKSDIYFVGRADDQIKIRGFRIQLAEIEQQLVQLNEIEQAVVIATKLNNDTLLTAYYITNKKSTVTAESIRHELRSKLPAYMLPQHYIALDTLPLTPNGKLDKRKLPLPSEAILTEPLLDCKSPLLSNTQSLLAECWQQQFKLAVSSINENFFELGGNSLMAVKLASFISDLLSSGEQQGCRHDIYAKDIFNYPSILALSNYIDEQKPAHLNPLHIEATDNNQNIYKASLSQQRLWFIQQLQAESPVYNMPMVLKLNQKLSENVTPALLQDAFIALSEQHQLLRASFIDQQGSAFIQLNETKENFCINEECFNTEAELQQAIHCFSTQSFLLDHAPLLRINLYTCRNTQNNELTKYLCINLHHIIADGWSAQLLLKDLFNLFSSSPKKIETNLINYTDFAHWQYSNSAQDIYQSELKFWKKELDQAPSSLNLSTNKIRPAQPSGKGEIVTLSFSRTESGIIRSKARSNKLSLFSLLAASYQLLLARYCDQRDICIGFPVHGRDNPQTHSIVGLFANNLVLRQVFDGTLTIKQLLHSSSAKTLAALAHQNVPFDKVLEQLDIEKTQSFIPLLQASFSCEEQQLSQLVASLSDDTASLVDSQWNVAKYDLHLSCFTEDNIDIELAFNSDIFNASYISDMALHFKTLCLALCEMEEDSPVLEVSFLSGEETQQQISSVKGFNATQFNYPELQEFKTPAYLHQLFEQQAEQTPNALAVRDDITQLTYQSLDQQANQLANYLVAQGVKPGNVVACLLNRSVGMSIALLGILKTGACYTPLLHDMPSERIQFILDETKAKHLIFNGTLVNEQLFSDLQTTELGSELIKEYPSSAPEVEYKNNNEHIFNIIYTSGSTGKPKGVIVPQAGIINRLLWMQRYTPLDTNDRILQKTPYNFDVSGWELFWPLLVGASIHYLAPELHKDPEEIAKAIIHHNISTVHFVPSMLQAFNYTENAENCSSLKYVFSSGEALQTSQANELLNKLPGTELHNLYGPTEASIDVSYYSCTAESKLSSVPIGRVIDNIRLYILDSNKQLMPLGAAGELYISGVGLSRGYLNRPEQNLEAFSSNPFKQASDTQDYDRLYRTGDLVRFLADGNIEYLGRNDNQVKLRGLRIELGEIEHELLKHESVLQSAVLLQNINNQPQLVAYYVSQDDEKINDEELRQSLANTLPAYMLPFCFIPLENFPLSPNGKLDKKQLPQAEKLLSPQLSYVAPQNETEEVIASMFEDILNVEKIGIYDNFFFLGGHSLLATKLAANIRTHFECPFELKEIFNHPTVHGISLAIIEQCMLQLGMEDDDDLLALLDDL